MEKNQLKWYDAPTVEVVELEAKVSLLAGSNTTGGVTTPEIGGGSDEGWD